MTARFYIDGEWVSLNELEESWKMNKSWEAIARQQADTLLKQQGCITQLDDKLDAVKAWFNDLPVYTISHLCTVLVPFKDETVSPERTLYTILKEILEVE